MTDFEIMYRLAAAFSKAREMEIPAYFFTRYDDVVYYCFEFPMETFTDTVYELGPNAINYIEETLERIRQEKLVDAES
jgi:hypothetical protein